MGDNFVNLFKIFIISLVSFPAFAENVTLNFSGNILKAGTCTAPSSNVAVTLPDVFDTDFNGLGSTSGSKAFTITLNCTGEISSSMAKYRIVPGSAGYNTSYVGVINLDGSSTASGVGIQILYNNNPVALNTSLNLGAIAGSGTYNYTAFSARYLQTTASVVTGSAIASATLEITYL